MKSQYESSVTTRRVLVVAVVLIDGDRVISSPQSALPLQYGLRMKKVKRNSSSN